MGGEAAPCARLCGMRSASRGGRLEHREGRCLLEEEGEGMRSRTALLQGASAREGAMVADVLASSLHAGEKLERAKGVVPAAAVGSQG